MPAYHLNLQYPRAPRKDELDRCVVPPIAGDDRNWHGRAQAVYGTALAETAPHFYMKGIEFSAERYGLAAQQSA